MLERLRLTPITVLVGLGILLGIPPETGHADDEIVTVEVLADHSSYEPGQPARLALKLDIEPGWHVNNDAPPLADLIPTTISFELPEGWSEPALRFPEPRPLSLPTIATPLLVYEGSAVIVARLTVPATEPPGVRTLRGTLEYQACDAQRCVAPRVLTLEVALPIGERGAPQHADLFEAERPAPPSRGGESGSPPAAGASPEAPLAAMLLFGFLGGLILNVMPCVLPVLSLKVFGVMAAHGAERRAVRLGALATAGGIVVSFWALAGLAAAAKSGGAALGWGVQFQSPVFVAALSIVTLLFSMNLWGLFAIPLPAALAELGSGGPRAGLAGDFAAGLFATLLATPCTAPFLGTALGFALGASHAASVAVFSAVAVGMAFPHLSLAAFPRIAAGFPRPGAWMETARGALGFSLAAALVWLLYVLDGILGSARLAGLQLALLGLALGVWLRARAGGVARAAGIALALGAGVCALAIAWRAPAPLNRVAQPAGGRAVEWVGFDLARAQALAAAGTPVFVEVTADWCITCKVNAALVVDTRETAELFRAHDVVAMRADWTQPSEAIQKYLAGFGRAGIPFYALYRPGRAPVALPEVLRPGDLRRALER